MATRPDNSSKTAVTVARASVYEAAVCRELATLNSKPLSEGLYLVASPIGHLGDVTLRALAVLTNADAVYCEDTRTSQKLLSRYGISRALRTYHEHNAFKIRGEIIADISNGGRVVLMCDAGTPGISDPGFKLVRAVIEAGGKVISVPGPVAAVAALTISGIPTDRFLFAGFLNSKSAARKKELQQLAKVPASLLFYEAPHRLLAMLTDLIDTLGDRHAVVVRELTKKYEECKRGQLTELTKWAASAPVRGELTIIVAPPSGEPEADITDNIIRQRLLDALPEAPLSKAAKQVAEELGVSKKRVYAVGLELKQNS